MKPTLTMWRTIGLAAVIWSAPGAAVWAQTPPPILGVSPPGSRTPTITTGRALDDTDSTKGFSQRNISRRQHQPPEQSFLPQPNLRPDPPLTLDVAPIPLPDPRPPALFNKSFPGLRFEREQESGFTELGG